MKKILVVLLAMLMIVGALPVSVSATEDKTPPEVTILEGYPQRTSETTAIVKFTTNENGSYYYGFAPDDGMHAISMNSSTAKPCTSGTVTIEITGITGGSIAQMMSLCVRDTALNRKDISYIVIPAESSVTDFTSPTITLGDVTRSSDTSATVKFTSDEAGLCQYAYGDSYDDVILLNGTTFTCDTTEQTISLENLTPGAKYMKIWVRDATGNPSNVLTFNIPAAGSLTPTTTITNVEIFNVKAPINGAGPDFMWSKPTEHTTYTRGDAHHYPIWHVSDTKISEIDFSGLITGGGTAHSYNQGGILAPESGNPQQLIFETGKWYTFIVEIKAVNAVFSPETTATMNDNPAIIRWDGKTTAYVGYSFQCTATGGQGGGSPLPGSPVKAERMGMWSLITLIANRHFKMDARAGEGGSIVGPEKIKFGRDVTYTITPDEGYSLVSVIVDGKNVGAVGEYTFKKVRAQHRIEAVFAPIPVEEVETPVAPDAEGLPSTNDAPAVSDDDQPIALPLA